MNPETPRSLQDHFQEIQWWRKSLPVLYKLDHLLPRTTMERVSKEVIEEALPEAEFNHLLAESVELVDGLIFLLAELAKLGITIDFFDLAYNPITLNGHGSSSGFYQELTAAVGEIPHSLRPELDAQHALSLILARIYAISPLAFTQLIDLVLEKNKLNRPGKNHFGQEYYCLSWRGRHLSEEEVIKRYQHNERCFRVLRDHFGSPLEQWMHELVTELILDFDDPSNFSKLKVRLRQIDAFLNRMFAQGKLIPGQILKMEGLELIVTVRMREHALKTAGAVLIE